MGFLQKLFRKQATERPFVAVYGLGQPVSMPKDFNAFSEEGYKKAVVAYRCINYIASAVAEIPWLLHEGRSSAKREIVEHPILALLENPNPLHARESFMEAMVSYFLLCGNTYPLAVAPSENAPPTELWLLRPDRTKVIPGERGLPAGWTYGIWGKETTFSVDQLGRSPLLHVKSFNPNDDWYGLSPIQVASSGVDFLNAGALWNLSLMQNSARPCGAFVMKADERHDGVMTDEQRVQFKQEMAEAYQGAGRAGRPMVLEGGMDWKEMGFSPRDMDWLNGKKSSETDVCRAFGVPGQLIGIEGSMTFANYEQARMAFYQETVIPLAKVFRARLQNWLMPRYGKGLFLSLDIDAIDALSPLREKRWEQVSKASHLTPNEKRELTGYANYEPNAKNPADMLYVPTTTVPIEQAAMGANEVNPLTDTEDITSSAAKPKPGSAKPTGEPRNESEGAPGDNEEAQGGKASPEPESKQLGTEFLEGKDFNIRSDSGKLRFWLRQEKDRQAFERAMKHQVAGVFEREKTEFLQAFKGMDRHRFASLVEYTVHHTLQKTRPQMKRVMETQIRATMEHFGKGVLSIAKSFPHFETKSSDDKFESFIDLYLERTMNDKLDSIYRTTESRLKKKLRSVERDGEIEEAEFGVAVEDTLVSLYASFKEARSETISRTETHTAAQEASRGAAKALQIPHMKKEWVAAQDERTREGHAEAHGMVVDLDAKFQVPSKDGADDMDGPGDRSAPADQCINCRCQLTYSTDDSNDDEGGKE